MTTAVDIEQIRRRVEDARTRRARLDERREALKDRIRGVKSQLEEQGIEAGQLPGLIEMTEQLIQETHTLLEGKLNGQ